jgi:hypothetical protein
MLKRDHLVNAVLFLGRRAGDEWEYGAMAEPADDPVPTPRPRPRPGGRQGSRTVGVVALTVIFFAGASFTAVAGDQAATLLEDYDATESPLPEEDLLALEEGETTADEETLAGEDETVPAEAPAPEALPEPAETPAPAEVPAASEEPALASEAVDPTLAHELEADPAAEVPAPAAAEEPAALEAPAAPPTTRAAKSRPRARKAPARAPKPDPAPETLVVERAEAPPAREPEIEHDPSEWEPTIWLNRALPDPTPSSKRLTKRFAKELRTAARRHGADWAAVLAVLRADGARGAAPATKAELDTLAQRLAKKDTWRAALALSGRTEFADRAEALRDYYRAVGLRALVKGLKASKERLVKKLLKDERVWVYWGGREDLEADRIDVRIVVLLAYLAERHESVTVSSLVSGHRKYARPGVISAHTYGQAVDIAAVGGTSVLGNSQPGGMTEDAVRSILLLPAELQPQQVISLLGLGGPSFPLADHGDHIHVGY